MGGRVRVLFRGVDRVHENPRPVSRLAREERAVGTNREAAEAAEAPGGVRAADPKVVAGGVSLHGGRDHRGVHRSLAAGFAGSEPAVVPALQDDLDSQGLILAIGLWIPPLVTDQEAAAHAGNSTTRGWVPGR